MDKLCGIELITVCNEILNNMMPCCSLTILFAGRGRDIVLNCHSSCLTTLCEEYSWKNNKKKGKYLSEIQISK